MILALLLSANALVAASHPPEETCETWRTAPVQARVVWLHGFVHGYAVAVANANSDACRQAISRSSGMENSEVGNYRQISEVMTSLCADPANVNIDWSSMVKIALAKLGGQDVEVDLRILRLLAAQALQKN